LWTTLSQVLLTTQKLKSLGVHTINHLLYADDLVILSESPTGLLHGRAGFILCERQRALYGIKCVLRIFLTNMATHTDG
jgi:hypothetical protein